MPDYCDDHQPLGVQDLVDDAVPTDSDSVEICRAGELLDSGRAGVIRESVDASGYALLGLPGEIVELPTGWPVEPDLVGHETA